MSEKRQYTFIDLFAGIGGMRLGFENAGYQCVYSSENDNHAKQVYNLNFKEEPHGDITKIDISGIPDHNVLLAGFPCQSFSISGQRKGFSDIRGSLFFEILKIVNVKQPDVVVLENVKHLVYHNKGKSLHIIVDEFNKLGYKVSWNVMNSKNFGVPQNRERLIIVCSKKNMFQFQHIKECEEVTLNSFLESDVEFEYLNNKDFTLIDDRYITKQKSGLIFVGYRNKTIRKDTSNFNNLNLSRTHRQQNRIYSVSGVHPTLTSQETSGRYYILENDKVRKLSLRECFRIMGFPDDFKLLGSKRECYKRIGNSVCIPLINAIANEIERQILKGV